jgi:hypothetical protein
VCVAFGILRGVFTKSDSTFPYISANSRSHCCFTVPRTHDDGDDAHTHCCTRSSHECCRWQNSRQLSLACIILELTPARVKAPLNCCQPQLTLPYCPHLPPLLITMSSEFLEMEMPPRPGDAAGAAPPPRQQRTGNRKPRPHETGPAFQLLPPFGKIGTCPAIQQEHVNAAVDSVLRYMSTNAEEAVSSVLSAAYRLPRIAPILARVVSTVAAADEDFHAAVVTRLVFHPLRRCSCSSSFTA